MLVEVILWDVVEGGQGKFWSAIVGVGDGVECCVGEDALVGCFESDEV